MALPLSKAALISRLTPKRSGVAGPVSYVGTAGQPVSVMGGGGQPATGVRITTQQVRDPKTGRLLPPGSYYNVRAGRWVIPPQPSLEVELAPPEGAEAPQMVSAADFAAGLPVEGVEPTEALTAGELAAKGAAIQEEVQRFRDYEQIYTTKQEQIAYFQRQLAAKGVEIDPMTGAVKRAPGATSADIEEKIGVVRRLVSEVPGAAREAKAYYERAGLEADIEEYNRQLRAAERAGVISIPKPWEDVEEAMLPGRPGYAAKREQEKFVAEVKAAKDWAVVEPLLPEYTAAEGRKRMVDIAKDALGISDIGKAAWIYKTQGELKGIKAVVPGLAKLPAAPVSVPAAEFSGLAAFGFGKGAKEWVGLAERETGKKFRLDLPLVFGSKYLPKSDALAPATISGAANIAE